jgi:hypothetical protein
MTVQEMLADLAGTKCRCGARKKPRRSVCMSCWRLLSDEEQRALYRRFGSGYEAAYAAALKSLGTLPEQKPLSK